MTAPIKKPHKEVSVKQCAKLIELMVTGEWLLREKVGHLSPKSDMNINVDFGTGYLLTFTQNQGKLGTVLCGKTPKGLTYREAAGNPLSELSHTHYKELVEMLSVNPYEAKVEVHAFYSVTVNGDRVGQMLNRGLGLRGKGYPVELKAGNVFDSKEDADKAAEKYEIYHMDMLAKDEKGKGKKKKR